MSRTMLNEQSLPQKFWGNAVDTSTYILNRIFIRAILGKTPYEVLRGRKPTLDYFRVFRSKCFVLNTKDYLTKFDPKSYEGVFLSYSQNSKAYIILNKHTRKIEESLNVTFDETPPPSKTSPLVDVDLDVEEAIKVTEKKNLEKDIVDETLEIDEIVNIKESRNHPLENIIGNLTKEPLGSTCQDMCDEFAKIMHDEFEMSMMGELNFFLGLQIKQMEDGPWDTNVKVPRISGAVEGGSRPRQGREPGGWHRIPERGSRRRAVRVERCKRDECRRSGGEWVGSGVGGPLIRQKVMEKSEIANMARLLFWWER
ncbi:retrovirus-related pol polyprotein from transposon TNT 1-94 [Tanacetum coccineum]